ncbi:MAG: hypothetical protein WBG47_05285 [Gordonia sp. (in: high G+C Gram-positive bacteria)]|uniref:hypothetical protein n=1 Tax=Gordonia sp. (in: high G+C Gram-positive bacteria) TaxID=84139 RepID=UPI003C7679FA
MTARTAGSTTTLPGLLLGKSSDAWGDERERSVMLEAYAYVFVLATIVLWTVAAVIAWFVPWWVTLVLFLALIIPSMEWQRYCKARDVDANLLAYGGSSWLRATLIGVYFGVCAISMTVAVLTEIGRGNSVTGGLIGGVLGMIGAVTGARWAARRKAQRLLNDDDAQ